MIELYPPQSDYGAWMCVRAENDEGDVYLAIQLDTSPTDTSTQSNTDNQNQQTATEQTQSQPATDNSLQNTDDNNTENVDSTISRQDTTGQNDASIDSQVANEQHIATQQQLADGRPAVGNNQAEKTSNIANTGVLEDSGNWAQLTGYILIAGVILGIARVLIVKKYTRKLE